MHSRPRPPDGRILVRSSRKDNELIWSFSDTGKGIGAGEATHLFDPFFCGRQAGRGLGLGLPRAAKIVNPPADGSDGPPVRGTRRRFRSICP